MYVCMHAWMDGRNDIWMHRDAFFFVGGQVLTFFGK